MEIFLYAVLFGTILGVTLRFVFYLIDNPQYVLASFYACCFVQSIVFSGRVREVVAGQIVFFLLHVIIAHFSYSQKHRRHLHICNIPETRHLWIPLAIVVFVSVITGYLRDYYSFQILIDVYKVAEIVMFYYILSVSCRTVAHVDKLLNALVLLAFLIGSIQIFTTQRGGIGMQMLLIYFPIYVARRIHYSSKSLILLIIASFMIVFFSQTRTYMAAYTICFFFLICCVFSRHKFSLVFKMLLCTIFSLCVAFYLYNSDSNGKVHQIIDRIAALENGFEKEGGYRLYEIQTALEKFNEMPIFGTGYGYKEYLYIRDMGYFEWGDFVHNTYIEILMKVGIFGSLIYSSIILILGIKVLRLVKSLSFNPLVRNIVYGGIFGSITWFLIFAAAPRSSYGVLFVSLIFALLYKQLILSETKHI